MERNQFLEMHGLHWESETHEWFNDKTITRYAQNNSNSYKDGLPNIFCFIVRNKQTGEYDRVVFDNKKNEVIYDTKSLEDISFYIDRLKVQKRFEIK